MRRKDREVTDPQFIENVLNKALYGNLGLSDNGEPYIVPMCYAWSENKVWFHCANEGRKLDIIRVNPKVCFQVSADTELITAENPCNYGMYYSSVVIFGTASILDDNESKSAALVRLMRHFRKGFTYNFTEEEMRDICIISIEPYEITCKARVK
ncbi:MAG: pyridoxamine 5'-phosphate oxidase family protein [Synergistaceae bacterium]|nr:pyridoxamine 5'-phosphate oxidase family protein [Synergistaceae bacterium]